MWQFADGGYRFPPRPLGGVVLETNFGGVSGLSAFGHDKGSWDGGKNRQFLFGI